MTTCERCGANAVNARGVCEHCGWRAARSGVAFGDDSSPSLGETRAADVLPNPAEQRTTIAPGTRAPNTPMPPLERTTGMPNAPRSTADARPQYSTAAPSSTARYCGTCGARIAPGEAFCGQCGTPVGAGSSAGTSLQPASGQYSRYHVSGDSSWSTEEGDALTEAFVPASSQPYARGISGGRGGYMSSSPGATAAPASASAHTGRIIVGVICLTGSLASAIGAIVLALSK